MSCFLCNLYFLLNVAGYIFVGIGSWTAHKLHQQGRLGITMRIIGHRAVRALQRAVEIVTSNKAPKINTDEPIPDLADDSDVTHEATGSFVSSTSASSQGSTSATSADTVD